MSIAKWIITGAGFRQPTLRCKQRPPVVSSLSPGHFPAITNGISGYAATTRLQPNETRRRRFHVCNAGGGEPRILPSNQPGPPNFMYWILGLVLPFLSKKWASLLKIKNEVETSVKVAEDIAVTVAKVADEVEKVAEGIAGDLPEGGRLRRAVDFVEHVAEAASNDAHLVEDFIDEVEIIEEKVEGYVEHLAKDEVDHIEPEKIKDVKP